MESVINNMVELVGEVHSEPVFSHRIFNETFYKFFLKAKRLSEQSDYINITISEHLLGNATFSAGNMIYIAGQFRSHNNYSGTGNKLILTVFVKVVEDVTDEFEYDNPNKILLNGYICKPPVFRITPFGREITDLLIAVNRTYNKSDYIPCIAWGHNARLANTFEVGDNIAIEGRIQSRNYQKQISPDNIVTKTAYEISISKLCKNMPDDEDENDTEQE